MKNIILLCLLSLPFMTQAEITLDLERCSKLDKDKDRLDCFDTVAAYYKQHKVPQNSIDSVIPTKSSDTLVLSKEGTFGKSTSEITDIDKIESTIVGDFNGWIKGAIITLANGQKWQVTSSSKGYTKLTNPKVEIERGFWDSFNMKVEGLNSKAKVKRLD
jgi:hypothetical protein